MTSPGPILFAALWMVGTIASFTLMGVSGRELSADLNTFQILFWRSVVGVIVVSMMMTRAGWGLARTRRHGVHLIRNVIHFGGQFCWFYGLSLIPIAEVFAIEFTTPIWTLLFAAVLLSERITGRRVVTIMLGFAGILIILRPGMSTVQLAQITVVGAAMLYAMTHVLTKYLVRTDAPLTVLFYMTLIQAPLGLATALPDWVWPSVGMAPWILLVGVSALSAHYCLSRALTLADAAVVIPIDFLRLPVAMLAGYLLYAETVEIWVLVGAAIIFAGNYINVRAEHRQGNPITKP